MMEQWLSIIAPVPFYFEFKIKKALTYAFCTLPDFKHLVHTLIDFGDPSTIALILCTFGLKVLLLILCEKVTVLPAFVPLPQTSHVFAI